MSLTEDDKRWLADRFKELETRILAVFQKWEDTLKQLERQKQ
jgi:hypothetical protein